MLTLRLLSFVHSHMEYNSSVLYQTAKTIIWSIIVNNYLYSHHYQIVHTKENVFLIVEFAITRSKFVS